MLNKELRNKILSIFAVFILLVGQVGFPLAVYAETELPSAPSAPSAPSTPEAPSAPDSPEQPDEPEQPDVPTEPESTEEPVQPTQDSSPAPSEEEPTTDEDEIDSDLAGDGDETPDESLAESSSPPQGSYSGDNLVGDPKIETGDSSAAGAIVNTGNNNYTGTGSGYGSGSGSVAITNEGNGTDSTNSGSAVVDETNTTTQGNIADVNNSLILGSSTGENSTSRNVGSSSIDTGDADVTGTIVNALNTNVDGLLVAEFNVADDQIGDLILDFGAYCISGCGGDSVNIANTDNGSDSENDGSLTLTEENTTTQTNDATLTNDLTLSANSGDNIANDNTGGDSIIDTGDANVSGNVVNFVNNNLAGNVIYGVVNIFGDFIGDIVLPESYLAELGFYGFGTDVSIDNSGNGTGSDNTGTVDLTQTDEFTQINDATILNNVILDGSTGGNTTSDNTGGDNSITTGDVDIDATVVNIANTNVVGGTWWIVLVNEAGNWFGKILGAPSGSNYAGSAGTLFALSPDGIINITNEGNGSGSDNTGTVTSDVTNTTTQTNNAVITNNIDLSANTGGNSASRNTGGDSKINTGDANIMLNLVNFVNNNFAGGNVVFTVVNVFGSWIGDFVTPGNAKQTQAAGTSSQGQQQGGTPSSGTGVSSGSTDNSSQPTSGSETGGASNSGSGTSSAPQGNTSVSGQGSPSSYSSPVTQIAGFTTSSGTGDNQENAQIGGDIKKKLRINLAWALIIIPLGGAAIFGIRKLNKRLA